MHPHDRRCGADGIEQPWPGYVIGGGHSATGWRDEQEDYRTNEIAINWQAGLVYALAGFVGGPRTAWARAHPAGSRTDLALRYDRPATDWMTEALPIGNGSLGAMLFGGVDTVRIQFNEQSLWTGDEKDTSGDGLKKGAVVTGTVTEVNDGGIEVRIADSEMTAFIRRADLSRDRNDQRPERFSKGEKVDRDAFGHVKLDQVTVGDWFGKQFGKKIGADKTLVQKSGYFRRSAAANTADLDHIRSMVHVAVDSALAGVSGVVGHDEEHGDELRAIEFPRIKGGKHFDPKVSWFADMLKDIGQIA